MKWLLSSLAWKPLPLILVVSISFSQSSAAKSYLDTKYSLYLNWCYSAKNSCRNRMKAADKER